jgi:hypothetical protein
MTIKKKAHEKLDDTNIKRVITALNSENSITKKEACEMLNISYNTTRLTKIINNYKEEQEYKKERKSKNRGKPVTQDDLKEMITKYLIGIPVSHIAAQLYRSPAFVKGHIDRIGVPTRVALGEEFIVPDECVKETFEIGEWVWFNDSHPNAKGGKAGKIVKNLTSASKRAKDYECGCYAIHYWVGMEWQEDFWVPWWSGIKRWKSRTAKLSFEIGSIQHLIDNYGLNEETL